MEKFKPSHPHLWLYCKSHYAQKDEIEDLRKIVAHFCGATDLAHVNVGDVLHLLAAAATDAILHCYENNPQEIFNVMRDVQQFSVMNKMFHEPLLNSTEYLIRVYRNIIMMAPTKFVDLPKADPAVLPLKEKETT